ncbi:unnamed protein product [Staurois parvus]|uniref:Uncharacterized protein n=1 Tax=Staurois parvus TaxID=386267 RepID=A0ABN9GZ63_9NEOB|nr:unnamed protein product [Staurois parvus]
MCIYYFCLQEPVKHCNSDQQITGAMQVSCRSVRISACSYRMYEQADILTGRINVLPRHSTVPW